MRVDALNLFGLVLGLTFIAIGFFHRSAEIDPGLVWMKKYVPMAKWLGTALFMLTGTVFVYFSLRTMFSK
jgi:hypothetical protein